MKHPPKVENVFIYYIIYWKIIGFAQVKYTFQNRKKKVTKPMLKNKWK